MHIIHTFPSDFYGADLAIIILGYLRPEKDYAGVGACVCVCVCSTHGPHAHTHTHASIHADRGSSGRTCTCTARTGADALIADIRRDIEQALAALALPEHAMHRTFVALPAHSDA